jgi:hypothetical protein
MTVVRDKSALGHDGPIPVSQIDLLLTAQIAVAWAGEGGEEPRLNWWRTDLASEFGGQDLFQRLVPHTWRWAVFQGVREAARRRDVELRNQDNDPDRIISLYRLGFAVDEAADQRLQDLKRSGRAPLEALPGLRDVCTESWSSSEFADWVQGHGRANCVEAPIGRRLKGSPPESLDLLVRHLVAGLAPLAEAYPLPHYRRAT